MLPIIRKDPDTAINVDANLVTEGTHTNIEGHSIVRSPKLPSLESNPISRIAISSSLASISKMQQALLSPSLSYEFSIAGPSLPPSSDKFSSLIHCVMDSQLARSTFES